MENTKPNEDIIGYEKSNEENPLRLFKEEAEIDLGISGRPLKTIKKTIKRRKGITALLSSLLS